VSFEKSKKKRSVKCGKNKRSRSKKWKKRESSSDEELDLSSKDLRH
jgi:hypothetical protein